MRSSFTLVLILLMSLGSLCLAAPESITVRGVVEDQTSSVVPNAAVELAATGKAQTWSAVTDNTGTFRFDSLLPGSYVMTIHHDGFETKTLSLNVGDNSPDLLEIVLVVSELHQEIAVVDGS
jgi:Carboxypeptidase regulatory-like domain